MSKVTAGDVALRDAKRLWISRATHKWRLVAIAPAALCSSCDDRLIGDAIWTQEADVSTDTSDFIGCVNAAIANVSGFMFKRELSDQIDVVLATPVSDLKVETYIRKSSASLV